MENTSTVNALMPAPFPNGNSIVGPSVLEYANRYRVCLNHTAASILSLTETVYDARQKLCEDEFKQFREEVGLNSKATVSKYLAIGEKSSKLKKYSDRLPHAWTTLYRLAQLDDADFKAIETSINPDMTASKINHILNPGTNQIAKDTPDIKLYLTKLEDGQKKGFLKNLTKLMKSYQVEFKTSGDFSIEIKKIRNSTAAWILEFPKGHPVADDNQDIAA